MERNSDLITLIRNNNNMYSYKIEKTEHKIFNTLFIDIKTASFKPSFEDLSPNQQCLWKHKANHLTKNTLLDFNQQLIEDLYREKAAIYSEFGKIICISVGIFIKQSGRIHFKTKSFSDSSEKNILEGFIDLIRKKFNNPLQFSFCGHNIQEFDIPYICRRSLINGISLPNALNIQGKKAWQIKHIKDTLQLWKFGDYKHFTSLNLLCDLFNIPHSPNLLERSIVEEADELVKTEIISQNCEQDVKATAMLYCKMIGQFERLFKDQRELKLVNSYKS